MKKGICIVIIITLCVVLSFCIPYFIYKNNQGFSKKLIAAIESGDAQEVEAVLHAFPFGNVNSLRIVNRFVASRMLELPDESTPFQAACKQGNTEMIRLLIERGADVNAVGTLEMPAIIYAISRGDIEQVQLLIDAGAKVKNAEYNLLHHIGLNEPIQMVKLLEDISAVYDDSVLHSACMAGNSKYIRYLLEEKHLNPNWQDNLGMNALMWYVSSSFQNDSKNADDKVHGAIRHRRAGIAIALADIFVPRREVYNIAVGLGVLPCPRPMVEKPPATIRAVEQPCQRVRFAYGVYAPLDRSAPLRGLPCFGINDGFMGILENQPV